MLCSSCSKEVPEDAIYCPYCRIGVRQKPSSQPNTVSAICLVFGIVMLVGAFATYVYEERMRFVFSWITVYPLREWAFPLLIGGATLLIVYAALGKQR